MERVEFQRSPETMTYDYNRGVATYCVHQADTYSRITAGLATAWVDQDVPSWDFWEGQQDAFIHTCRMLMELTMPIKVAWLHARWIEMGKTVRFV